MSCLFEFALLILGKKIESGVSLEVSETVRSSSATASTFFMSVRSFVHLVPAGFATKTEGPTTHPFTSGGIEFVELTCAHMHIVCKEKSISKKLG